MAGAFASNPFAEIARRNMELFASAAAAGGRKAGEAAAKPAGDEDTRAELDALAPSSQEMQKKLDKIGR